MVLPLRPGPTRGHKRESEGGRVRVMQNYTPPVGADHNEASRYRRYNLDSGKRFREFCNTDDIHPGD